MIKAAIAGAPPQGSPDQQFEQGFFQLAYDKLQSKLYNLLPYMVGFEVVNKASDGTKAVGAFGFGEKRAEDETYPEDSEEKLSFE